MSSGPIGTSRSGPTFAPEVSSDRMLQNIKAASEHYRRSQELLKSGNFTALISTLGLTATEESASNMPWSLSYS